MAGPSSGFRLSCPPSSLGQAYHLLDVDSLDKSSGDSEYRRQKLPHFDSERLTLSAGFQAQPTQQSVATQTAPRQQRAAICQYEVAAPAGRRVRGGDEQPIDAVLRTGRARSAAD